MSKLMIWVISVVGFSFGEAVWHFAIDLPFDVGDIFSAALFTAYALLMARLLERKTS